MSPLIIGITGLHRDEVGTTQTIGAGKDAAAEVLIAKHGFVRIGVADPLKRICRDVFDFSDDQLWGPSDSRNAPDKRYPRGSTTGADNRKKYNELSQELDRRVNGPAVGTNLPATDLKPMSESELKKLREDINNYESWGWLTPRHALQQLGTQWGRDCYGDVWINYSLRIAHELLKDKSMAYTAKEGLIPLVQQYSQGEFEAVENWPKPLNGVVFSDIRFFNEYKAVKDAGGKVVRVRRFSWKKFNASVDKAHESETQLSGYADDKFDYVIDNSGSLHDLTMNVDRMYDVFTGRIIPYDESQKDIPPGLRQLQK